VEFGFDAAQAVPAPADQANARRAARRLNASYHVEDACAAHGSQASAKDAAPTRGFDLSEQTGNRAPAGSGDPTDGGCYQVACHLATVGVKRPESQASAHHGGMLYEQCLLRDPEFAAASSFRNVMRDDTKLSLRSADLDETIDAVSRLYCPHVVRVRGSSGMLSSDLEARRVGGLQIVDLRYSTRVQIDAGEFDNLMLIMSCVGGSASGRQGRSRSSWSRGQTLPMSPGVQSVLDFDAQFAQRSVRVDVNSLQEMCARRLGHPLDRPLRFELHPFSLELERAWQSGVHLALSYASADIRLPSHASKAFNEFFLSLLLDLAPHNYSDDIKEPHPLAAPRLLREAERLMRDASGLASVHEIAGALGISVRSLEAGFREWKRQTPVAFMRGLRLSAAREMLSRSESATSVTDVAVSLGFLHLPRFSQYYRAAFNEYPSETLRRCRQRRMLEQ
jgi:AraC-like DNA-binding protein